MPGDPHADSSSYVEKLSVPWHWWAIAFAIVAVGAVEIGAGFTWDVVLGVFAALGVPTAALLVVMGRARLRVDTEGIHIGGRSIGYDDIDTVEALDRRDTREWLGPRGDPAAFVVTRGWVSTAVLVRARHVGATPYWLVSSRRPDAVVEAVTRLARR